MELTPMNLFTTVKVLKGVPFDSNYNDVCDGYSSKSDQATKIGAYTKYTYNNLSPVRLQNVIRLPICADYIYDCNYIMWQNANFGTKWFYAFITKIDWVNVNCCHVYYELDRWNTWFFDYELGKCFIEREHVADDRFGQNLYPEGLETGDYIWNNLVVEGMSSGYRLAVVTTLNDDGTSDKDGDYCYGNMMGHIYSGLNIVTFDMSTQAGRRNFFNFLDNANNVPQAMDYSILGMYMVPEIFNGKFDDMTYLTSIQERPTSIDGYTPVNNKLLCYPYNFLHLSNSSGTTADFKYEYFYPLSNNDITFRLYCDISGGSPEVAMIPTKYNNQNVAWDDKVVIDKFPQVAWVSDTFRQWWALNKVNVASSFFDAGMDVYKSLGSFEHDAMKGSAHQVAQSTADITQGVNKMVNIYGNHLIHKSMPPQIHSGNNGNVLAHYGKLDFYSGQMCIREQFARQIDDFFTKFGYQVNRLGIPSHNHRLHWDFIKTADCTIDAKNMSFDDIVIIKNIFDNGTTVWHEISGIGDMSQTRILENRAPQR